MCFFLIGLIVKYHIGVATSGLVVQSVRAYPSFRFMKLPRLRLFLLPIEWDAIPSQVIPSINHLYAWAEGDTLRVV